MYIYWFTTVWIWLYEQSNAENFYLSMFRQDRQKKNLYIYTQTTGGNIVLSVAYNEVNAYSK